MKTLIIDGNNLIHRTFWTAKNQSKKTQTDSPEQLSNFHIYFTVNAVISYVSKYKPTTTIMVWDEKPDYRKNTRKDEFADYKGNRSGDSTPHQNNETIKKILSHLGIRSMYPRELEADDVIAYLASELEGDKVIVSVDRDFIQCISPQVMLFDPIRKVEFKSETFEEQTGWPDVHAWMDAKCCMGDKSDNVPGIPGFGKAKVAKFRKGEVKLTEEEFEIYKRNLSLFSLTAFNYKLEEQKYYADQVAVKSEPDWQKFLQECNAREFNSLLKKKESIYSLFFLKNKLQSIFG